MDAIEKAIRNALEKGNAEDRAFRERVYRSAFAALDRALQANPGVTVEVAIKRRKAIQATITEIESEFLPAVPDVGLEVDASAGQPAATAAPAIEIGDKTSSSAVAVDGPAPPASDAPRSRVLPVVPDIMPDATLPGAPAIDMSVPAASVATQPQRRTLPQRRHAQPNRSISAPCCLADHRRVLRHPDRRHCDRRAAWRAAQLRETRRCPPGCADKRRNSVRPVRASNTASAIEHQSQLTALIQAMVRLSRRGPAA